MKSSITGNQHIFDFLSKSIANKKLAHTYIFAGPADLGKATSAVFFAKTLLCKKSTELFKNSCDCLSCAKINVNKNIHSDLNILEKEADKKNISVEQVRQFRTKLNMSSFANSYKVGIIKEAENLNENSSNALLKTLEEPKTNVIVVLTTSNIDAILPTIRSRAQTLQFNLVDQDLIYNFLVESHGINREAAKNLSQMCMGRPALALKLSQEKDFLKEYLNKINTFISFNNEDINTRFNLIEQLIDKKLDARQANEALNNTIKTWQVITRDLLLLKLNCEDLIKNNVVLKDLTELQQKLSTEKLIELMQIFSKSKEYLRSNVSAKVVLENIAVQI